MLDSATVAALHAILRREGRSLLQYARDVYPWTTPEARSVLVELQRMIEKERDASDAIARLLVRRRVPLPYIGTYPMSFTSVNFIALNKLVPLLVEYESKSVAELRPDLASVNDAEAHALVQRLLELKEEHIEELKRLESPAPLALVS